MFTFKQINLNIITYKFRDVMRLKKDPPPPGFQFERQKDCGDGGEKFSNYIAKKTGAKGFFSNKCIDNKNNDDEIRFSGWQACGVGFMRLCNIL